MPENFFSERYRNYTNSSLLKIIENAADYEILAVEAAQKELDGRKLNAEQLAEAKAELDNEKLLKTNEREKYNAVANKIKKAANSFFESIYPFQKEKPSTIKQLNIFCIILIGVLIYYIFSSYYYFPFIIKDIPKWDSSDSVFIIPFVILPIGTFLLWKRKKIGWFMITIFYIHVILITTCSLVYTAFIYKPSGISSLDNLFHPPSTASHFFPIIFYSTGLFFLCKQAVLEIFQLEKKTMLIAIFVTTFLLIIILAKAGLIFL